MNGKGRVKKLEKAGRMRRRVRVVAIDALGGETVYYDSSPGRPVNRERVVVVKTVDRSVSYADL